MNKLNEEKILQWYCGHKDHVDLLLRQAPISYPPSDEDMNSPELWKPAHWSWYMEVYV